MDIISKLSKEHNSIMENEIKPICEEVFFCDYCKKIVTSNVFKAFNDKDCFFLRIM